MTTATAYAAITKTHKQPDGSLMVHGVVSDSGLDSDGQRMSGEWLRKSLGEWFGTWANIREGHGKTAAGVGVELTDAGNDRWELKSHIVDPGTVAKVEAGVLKGYSIAATKCRIEKGRADAPNGLVVAGEVYEVSLVDRPANDRCRIQILKSHGGQLELSDAEDDDTEDDDVPPFDDQHDDEEDEEMTHKSYVAALDLVEQALTGELHISLTKSADANEMIDDTHEAVAQIAGLARAELLLLEQNAEAGDLAKGFNVGGLVRAIEALKTFVDPDASRMLIRVTGDGETLKKSFSGWVAGWSDDADGEQVKTGDVTKTAGAAIVDNAEIQKAVREAQAPLRAEVESLRGQMAEVLKQQIPGGPVVTTVKKSAQPTPTSERARVQSELSIIKSRASNPHIGAELRQADAARAVLLERMLEA